MLGTWVFKLQIANLTGRPDYNTRNIAIGTKFVGPLRWKVQDPPLTIVTHRQVGKMVLATTHYCFFMLFLIITLQLVFGTDTNVLNVGKELQKETIPLQNGSRIYKLQGLKPSTWYEVKISYPASIPASFSLQLKKGDDLNILMNHRRKLLNTEKLIFKNDDADLSNKQKSGTYVMLTVEPEGVVAIPNGKEREMVIYNIVCDELVLGIPHKAWWVVILAVLCLVLAFVIPTFLPSVLISTDRTRGSTSKNS